jgi:hypothetical protein
MARTRRVYQIGLAIDKETQPPANRRTREAAEAVNDIHDTGAARFYVALIKGRLNQARIPMPRRAFTAVRV